MQVAPALLPDQTSRWTVGPRWNSNSTLHSRRGGCSLPHQVRGWTVASETIYRRRGLATELNEALSHFAAFATLQPKLSEYSDVPLQILLYLRESSARLDHQRQTLLWYLVFFYNTTRNSLLSQSFKRQLAAVSVSVCKCSRRVRGPCDQRHDKSDTDACTVAGLLM